MTELVDPAKREWDAIVIGTGMGGATLGYALAKAGKSVLFCEKGKHYLNDANALQGEYAELFFDRPDVPRPQYRDILRHAGRWFDEIEDLSGARSCRFIPFIGATTGGSSALYGMALERFFPEDFTPKVNYPDADETTLPEKWPISYQELQPYYTAAEEIYRVRGGGDPLRVNGEYMSRPSPPPPLTPASQELFNFLADKNLHPYRLPMACEYAAGCRGCQGYLCAKNCKNDSARICLAPVLADYDAHLLDNCRVLRLEATHRRVTGVVCRRDGQELILRGRLIMLAAGALETPVLLLRSASPEWPDGLANDSGLVGKNLMRHFIDLYAVFPNTRPHAADNLKELAFNDFYRNHDGKFGTVQSFGFMPPPPVLVESMEQEIRDGSARWAASGFKLIKPLLRPFFRQIFARALVFASQAEDLPYIDNRVEPGNAERLRLHYHIRQYDKIRIQTFRQLLCDTFKPYRFMLIRQAENNQRIAHVCGTCRFGNDPKQSVLDANNKAHGLDNLYVVDSSFFPSSAGTNPSLTIAANALRVAAHLNGEI